MLEKGTQTFAAWLQNYNDLDVAPGLETLEKMWAFYNDKGLDILKAAVSLPGVSLHYLLRGTIERRAELYSLCKETYAMSKEAGKVWCSKGYHEAGVTRIRLPWFKQPKVCKRIIGYTTPTRSTCQRCLETCLEVKKRLCIAKIR